MKLMTKELERALPPLYSQDTKDASEVQVIVRYFTPSGAATWYVTEYDPETGLMFGLADLGLGYPELGYFSLRELEEYRGLFGLGVERDLYMHEMTLQDAMDRQNGTYGAA